MRCLRPRHAHGIAALAGRADVAVLTNNGPLVLDSLPTHLTDVIPRERIFCSKRPAATRHRSPSPRVVTNA